MTLVRFGISAWHDGYRWGGWRRNNELACLTAVDPLLKTGNYE